VFLNTDLTTKLGEDIANKFGRLPFLFKVLDVNDMLSIQVHPTKVEAEKEQKVFMPYQRFSEIWAGRWFSPVTVAIPSNGICILRSVTRWRPRASDISFPNC